MMATNNIIRMLESKKIEFTLFELPPEKIGALETAQILRIDPAIVFKSIVVVREQPVKPILAIIPGPCTVDLEKLAKAVNEKKLRIPTQQSAEQITGLQAGGISPLALLNQGFQFFIDEKALDHDQIHISAGQRGLNIRISVKDLIHLINARVINITSSPKNSEDVI